MTQNISISTPNTLGSINRIGTSNDGRGIYQITDSEGKVAGKMSVAPQDCDKFESSYNKMLASAPKLQSYMQNTSPEKMQKKQKLAKWLVGGGAIIGGLWPALKVKGTFKQITLTLLGTGAGLASGVFLASKIITPPGAKDFSQATQTISKLDIQPLK